MSICPTTGKTQYSSKEKAEQGLEFFKKKLPDYIGESYYCLYCNNYHFGRKKEPVISRRKRT